MLLIFYLVLGLTAVYLYFSKRERKLKGKVLDGPKGLPLIGCILEINDRNIPFKLTKYAGQFGQIFRMNMLMNNVVVLNSEDIIRKAFGGDDHKRWFNDREEMFFGIEFRGSRKSVTFITDGTGSYFKTAKKGMMQALHTYGSGLQDLENNVMIEMDNLLKIIHDKPGKEFECVAMLQRSLSNVISLVLTGETIADDDPNCNLFWEMVHNGDFFMNSQVNIVMMTLPFVRFLPGKYRNKYLGAKKAIAKIAQKYFYDVKKTYIAGEVRGIVDHYIEIQRKEMESNEEIFYTDAQIIADLLDIIHAGITTTLSALANTMLILLNHPEYQKKLQAEIDRIIGRDRLPGFRDRELCTFYQAFELEVYRYVPMLPLLVPHLCSDHVELEGYDIEGGSTVIANIWYVHHNKEIWGDPWVFRPERFLDEHGNLLPKEHALMKNLLQFGYGPRLCPGMGFAKTRYFLYVASLLQHLSLEFPEDKFIPCDPRLSENFEIKQIYRALPFFCRFKKRL